MDARRQMIVVFVGLLGTAACHGCASPIKSPSDPFATNAKSVGAASEAAPTAPGSSINQVAYDSPVADAPGTSIQSQAATDEKPSLWKKVTKTLSQEQIEKSYRTVTNREVDEKVARDAYNAGDALFREKKYDEAAEKFAVAADRWPNSLLEEDALYMLGESYFFADRYAKSSDALNRLLKKYENSRHLDRAINRQFALARYWDEKGRDYAMLSPNFLDKTRPWFDTHGSGIKVYETIRLQDPTGPLADDAVMAQATAYFRDDRHEDAAYQYEILRKDYPQSEHQQQAHLLGLQSYMNSYQGPQYDRTPLKKAETLVDSTLRNLSHQMPEEKPRLQQAQAAIRAQMAERDYDMGEYYRRLGYNRAARQHYAVVLRDFSDTKFATLAADKMKETESLPDSPPDHFPWLTKWLGEE
jgi:outer membrane protein assembly factor BamD (BamD/ComL family)